MKKVEKSKKKNEKSEMKLGQKDLIERRERSIENKIVNSCWSAIVYWKKIKQVTRL